MKFCIVTDMEGLAGVDHWEQCYAVDDAAPPYVHGLAQLAAEAPAPLQPRKRGGETDTGLPVVGRGIGNLFTSRG